MFTIELPPVPLAPWNWLPILSVPPTWLTMPVEPLADVPVLMRTVVVRVPLLIFRMPVALAVRPTSLSWPLTGALRFKTGELVPSPKLSVPLLICNAHGPVLIAADAALSMMVQSAAPLLMAMILVPPGLAGLLKESANVPVPTNAMVAVPLPEMVFVKLPRTFSTLLAPFNVMLLP